MKPKLSNGTWRQLRERIRETWGVLGESELDEVREDWDRLVEVVQRRTGAGRRQIEHHLSFLREGG